MFTAAAVMPAQRTEKVLHNFEFALGGQTPEAGLARDSAGNLYGTTVEGGVYGHGVVFKIDSSGHETLLHSFNGADGIYPIAGVTLDSAGNIYGTASSGGALGYGVVYKLDKSNSANVLHSFSGGVDGLSPVGAVTLDAAGNIYGTTAGSTEDCCGTVFKIDASGQETVLYNFSGGADGSTPQAGVVLDAAGNLYGTTLAGGTSSEGVVYKLDPSGNETVLHTFTGHADGGLPDAGLIFDSAGNLYGTTEGGGSGGGVVFKIAPSGVETVLHAFHGESDGSRPTAGVVRDAAGNLYGTTSSGGGVSHDGTVFKIDSSGDESVLYRFSSSGSFSPLGGVVLDSAGNLYGTASMGETYATDFGSVFTVSVDGQETELHNFSEGAGVGGADPSGGLTRDAAGNFYGSTSAGGAGGGVIFKLNPFGKETVIYNFTGGADGLSPNGNLIRDSEGNFYGTTEYGGDTYCFQGCGVVFKIDPSGNETVLHTFIAGDDGGNPLSGLIRDSEGNLYGTARNYGAFGFGDVFKIDTSGNFSVVYAFSGGADGATPESGLVLGPTGDMYGTTAFGGVTGGWGTVYKVDTSGQETVIYSFTGTNGDGQNPHAGVTLDSEGNLYGTTQFGGSSSVFGTVYKVDTSGHETVLYNFMDETDGAFPLAGVSRDSQGNLYGTTYEGGASYEGVVYELSPTGQETTLYSFTGGDDGSTPQAGVIVGGTGGLYGTTVSGGRGGAGVVFVIEPPAN
jgi:uncharacterized repeat protein (TIGR03803 family)